MNAIRLALGTLTAMPVRAPAAVDRATAGRAMALAPLVGLLLVLPCLLLLWLLAGRSALVEAALVVALLTLLTRAIHLDGLADSADGLGSGKPAEAALTVMRKGDVGPFGVVALLLALLLQVSALAELLVNGRAGAALGLALVLSRSVLPIACLRGIPSARADGLGSTVAGTVGPAQLAAALVPAVLVLGYAALGATVPLSVTGAVASTVLGLGAGILLCRRCVHRLGGITGDVLGACVEVTFTVALVVLALT